MAQKAKTKPEVKGATTNAVYNAAYAAAVHLATEVAPVSGDILVAAHALARAMVASQRRAEQVAVSA